MLKKSWLEITDEDFYPTETWLWKSKYAWEYYEKHAKENESFFEFFAKHFPNWVK